MTRLVDFVARGADDGLAGPIVGAAFALLLVPCALLIAALIRGPRQN